MDCGTPSTSLGGCQRFHGHQKCAGEMTPFSAGAEYTEGFRFPSQVKKSKGLKSVEYGRCTSKIAYWRAHVHINFLPCFAMGKSLLRLFKYFRYIHYICTCTSEIINYSAYQTSGHTVAQLSEALCYKPEGRGIDSRWCHWNFSLT
jgi:hypothetical protein